jgi:hypothetical protein
MSKDAHERHALGDLPAPNAGWFRKLAYEDVVGLCLAHAAGPLTRAQVKRQLTPWLASPEVGAALEVLEGKGLVRDAASKPSLTTKGAELWKFAPGRGQRQSPSLEQRLVAQVLGCSLADPSQRNRIAHARTLPTLIVAAAYGLEPNLKSNSEVRSALVRRVLHARLSDLIGSVQFNLPSGPSQGILLSLAGLKSGDLKHAMAVLAARCVGLEKKAGAGELRMTLVRSALNFQPPGASQSTFSQRVLDVSRDVSTPPFTGRVAIAQVYDAYGKRYADAGSLADFKRRLLEAARKREINLQKVDMGELMGKDLRERSQVQWDTDVVHLLLVDRR